MYIRTSFAMVVYVHTQEYMYINPPIEKAVHIFTVYKVLSGSALCLPTFLADHRREGLRFGIDYGVDEIISPVLGHLQGRGTVLVLNVDIGSGRREGERKGKKER